MAETPAIRRTGFTAPLGRHNTRVVAHEPGTLAAAGATLVSRNNTQPYTIVDGVKVFRAAAGAAMDLAMRRTSIPDYMVYEDGKVYAEPAAPAAPNQPSADLSALIALAAGPAPVTPDQGIAVAQDRGTADLNRRLAADLYAGLQRIAALEAELAVQKAMTPSCAERNVVVIVPGFGEISLIVDYLYQRDHVLVLGTLRQKRRAAVAPKPPEGQNSITFKARIDATTYGLISFADLRFPFGDLDTQVFVIASTETA